MSVDICYVFSNGFSARMILHSGLVPHLKARGLSLAVVTPNACEESMRRLADRDGIQLEMAPPISGRGQREYHRMRRYLFEDVRNNPAIWARELKSRAYPPRKLGTRIRRKLYYPLNRASLRFPRFRRLVAWLERRALAQREIAVMLERIRPRVAVATYPIDALDASFLFEARRLGIHTVCHLLSWDNVTSKGRFPVTTDDYISWGPIMTSEIQEYYGTERSDIHECGVAHFDVHTRAKPLEQQACLLTSLGLDASKPYLFFGMSSRKDVPRELEIVEWLAAEVRRGTFGPDLQLVVRQHPQDMLYFTAEAKRRLEALAGGPVAVACPAMVQSRLHGSLDEDDLMRLSILVGGSAISLNSASTICIDAVVQDRPVIVTAFDANADMPWWQSTRRVLDYIHFRKLTELGGVRVVRSFEALADAIRAYLADPHLDAAGRAVTRQAECGDADGRASERIAQALTKIRDRARATRSVARDVAM